MRKKVRWGILSTARIGTAKVIPAMQRGEWSEVVAIASREPEKARQAAARLGIPKAYGSYEEMLADPDIEAIYNPLPNHMHVVRQRIVDRLDIRIGEHLLVGSVCFRNAQPGRGLARFLRLSGSDRHHLRPLAPLHGRDHLGCSNSGGAKNSPANFLAHANSLSQLAPEERYNTSVNRRTL